MALRFIKIRIGIGCEVEGVSIDQQIIHEIVLRVLRATRPSRIILFGSAATGEMTPDSDIDLLILKETDSANEEEWLTVDRALRGLPFPFDIVIMPVQKFEESKHIVGGIAYPANKYGKVIYEAA